MSSGYKPITVREEIYNNLERMKDKTNRSFSDVIEALANEKDKITEKDKIIEDLIKEKNKLIEENQILHKDIDDREKGVMSLFKKHK